MAVAVKRSTSPIMSEQPVIAVEVGAIGVRVDMSVDSPHVQSPFVLCNHGLLLRGSRELIYTRSPATVRSRARIIDSPHVVRRRFPCPFGVIDGVTNGQEAFPFCCLDHRQGWPPYLCQVLRAEGVQDPEKAVNGPLGTAAGVPYRRSRMPDIPP